MEWIDRQRSTLRGEENDRSLCQQKRPRPTPEIVSPSVRAAVRAAMEAEGLNLPPKLNRHTTELTAVVIVGVRDRGSLRLPIGVTCRAWREVSHSRKIGSGRRDQTVITMSRLRRDKLLSRAFSVTTPTPQCRYSGMPARGPFPPSHRAPQTCPFATSRLARLASVGGLVVFTETFLSPSLWPSGARLRGLGWV
jgi:hypothetical protein